MATMLRAALVALVTGLVGEPATPIVAASAAGAALLAAALDGVDGWLARRTRMTSAFGARFDMETDVFLVLALSVLAWQYGKAGAWVLLCGLMRYGFVAGGWLWPWLRGPLSPTVRGKAICVVQFVGLSLTIAAGDPAPVQRPGGRGDARGARVLVLGRRAAAAAAGGTGFDCSGFAMTGSRFRTGTRSAESVHASA